MTEPTPGPAPTKLLEGGAPVGPAPRRGPRTPERFTIDPDPGPGGLPAWRVRGSSGQSYRVTVPGFPEREGAQCNCPDFLTRGHPTCKHLEATLAYAVVHPPDLEVEPSSGPSWEDVEEGQAPLLQLLAQEPPADHGRLSRALRQNGRLLTKS